MKKQFRNPCAILAFGIQVTFASVLPAAEAPAVAARPAEHIERREPTPAQVRPIPSATPAATQAEELYNVAQKYERKGDIDQARRYYTQAHLQSPASPFGWKAVLRLQDLDRSAQLLPINHRVGRPAFVPSDTEESDATGPLSDQDRFEEMLRDTMPLSVVPARDEEN